MDESSTQPLRILRLCVGQKDRVRCCARKKGGGGKQPSDVVFFAGQDPQVSFHIRRSRIFDGLFCLFNLICPDLQNIVTS